MLKYLIVLAGSIFLLIGMVQVFRKKKGYSPTSHFEITDEMILRFAKLKGGIISALELASQTSLSPEVAQKRLEKLVQTGFAQLRVSESGNILYDFKQAQLGSQEKENSQLL
ncbi:MAG: hypothetical protein SFU27_09935 [Thermonemataceae bacterium]|nr:hypothetical protein [Thermonemataceae bacterium]